MILDVGLRKETLAGVRIRDEYLVKQCPYSKLTVYIKFTSFIKVVSIGEPTKVKKGPINIKV